MSIAICLYRSRHGDTVTAYVDMPTAHQVIATGILRDLVGESVLDADQRKKVLALIEGGAYEEAIDAFHDAQAGHCDVDYFEFYESEVIESAPAPSVCRCPKCGNEDPERVEIRETFSAYHPIGEFTAGKLFVKNALATPCPSTQFDDGAGDYVVVCKECVHEDTPEAFGLPASNDWEWV